MTAGTCGTCGAGLVSSNQWGKMSAAKRAELRAAGIRENSRRSECRRCKETRRREADKALVPSTARYTREELLAEWEMFVDHSQTLHANCAAIGPRLGMRPRTMAKALGRAGVRAWPVDALGWADKGAA